MPSAPLVVVGVCVAERQRYAQTLAFATNSTLLRQPDAEHAAGPVPVRLATSRTSAQRLVVELATDADLLHLDLVAQTPAASIVCVVDAGHMIDDLQDGTALIDDAPEGEARGDLGARARQAAIFLESASLICFVGWETVETSKLSLLMALASHLNPGAGVRLSRGADEDLRSLASTSPRRVQLAEQAGWVRALNDEHDPYMTDRRVTTLRYERLRPFHPGRLANALDEIETGRFGVVLRSAGFCRLATRSQVLARWEQVGSAMWIDPLTADMESSATGQDLALTGVDLNAGAIFATLDGATVTDAELAAGPTRWERFADPLPAWPETTEDADSDHR